MGDKNGICENCGEALYIGIGHTANACQTAQLERKIQQLELQIEELKKQAENMVDNSLTACRVAYKKGLEDQKQESDRLINVLQNHLDRIAHFTLDLEYYGPGESPAKACQEEAREALSKLPGNIIKRNEVVPQTEAVGGAGRCTCGSKSFMKNLHGPECPIRG